MLMPEDKEKEISKNGGGGVCYFWCWSSCTTFGILFSLGSSKAFIHPHITYSRFTAGDLSFFQQHLVPSTDFQILLRYTLY